MMVSAGSIVNGSFGFLRSNIPVIAVWCVVYMAGSVLMSLVSQPFVEAQAAMMETGQIGALPSGFLGYLALMYIVMFVMLVALFTAVYRAVLQPERSQSAYLRLGMDEARLFGLILIVIIGYILGTIIVMLAAVLVGFLISFLTALVGAIIAGTVIMILLIYGLILSTSIWFMVRLSAAGPLTILRGRIVIREAWSLTRGRFWPLFGGYLLVMLTVFAAFIPFFWLAMGSYYSALLTSASDPTAMGMAMRTQLEHFAVGKPMWFVIVIAGGILGGVAITLHGSMTAIATRDLLDEAVE